MALRSRKVEKGPIHWVQRGKLISIADQIVNLDTVEVIHPTKTHFTICFTSGKMVSFYHEKHKVTFSDLKGLLHKI